MRHEIGAPSTSEIRMLLKDIAEIGAELSCAPVAYSRYLKEAGKSFKSAAALVSSVAVPLIVGNSMRQVIGESMTEFTPTITFIASYALSCVVSASAQEYAIHPRRGIRAL